MALSNCRVARNMGSSSPYPAAEMEVVSDRSPQTRLRRSPSEAHTSLKTTPKAFQSEFEAKSSFSSSRPQLQLGPRSLPSSSSSTSSTAVLSLSQILSGLGTSEAPLREDEPQFEASESESYTEPLAAGHPRPPHVAAPVYFILFTLLYFSLLYVV